MKIYDITNNEGRLAAFEVDAAIGRRGLCRAVATIPGVRILRLPKRLSWLRESEFCEFDYGGVTFVAKEPFGDNSRYWVGGKTPGVTKEVELLRDALVQL